MQIAEMQGRMRDVSVRPCIKRTGWKAGAAELKCDTGAATKG